MIAPYIYFIIVSEALFIIFKVFGISWRLFIEFQVCMVLAMITTHFMMKMLWRDDK